MIKSVYLQNFRNHKDLKIKLDKNLTLVIGKNASGKTNILEAIHSATRGYSFRGSDNNLIKHNSTWSRVDIEGNDFSRSILLEKKDDNQKPSKIQKTYIINNTPYKRINSRITLPVVLFEPNHMLLIHGSPELRRDFIDDLLTQTVVSYRSWLLQYKRTLAQRNALLKTGIKRAKEQLFVWDIRLCDLGGRIASERSKVVELLNEQLQPLYYNISRKKIAVKISYIPLFDCLQYSSRMLRQLQINHIIDCERGFTSVGPHREDISFSIHNKPAEEVASRGETRSLILALKIASTYHLEQSSGIKPLLLLDDVFAELDEERQQQLSSSIEQYQKVITTTTTLLKLNGSTIKI